MKKTVSQSHAWEGRVVMEICGTVLTIYFISLIMRTIF